MVEAAPSSTARLGIVKRQPPGSSEKLREGASAMVQLLAIRKSCVLYVVNPYYHVSINGPKTGSTGLRLASRNKSIAM